MKLLDTDAVIDQLRRREHEPGWISVITLIEVLRGIPEGKRRRAKELIDESYDTLSLDNEAILTYCALYQELRERGQVVPDADLLIAATAMSRGIPLETGDAHFQRLKEHGLEIA
ncbi:MAG: type II toxin-antitoxin system VapC family toxin [Candidatus Bathyarchaeota archaeon]|nr:type II toxin-antitoxin system VapC family toxin [Candidatus Bathyarchaeota archaeon]